MEFGSCIIELLDGVTRKYKLKTVTDMFNSGCTIRSTEADVLLPLEAHRTRHTSSNLLQYPENESTPWLLMQ